jgi:uncharacterized protein
MAEGKLVILVTAGPENPRRCITPFHLAIVGAALEWDVGVYFTVDGSLLVKQGIAASIWSKADNKPVLDLINEALALGVSMYVCTPSMNMHDVSVDDLIDGIQICGGVSILQAAEDAKVVLTF